MKDVVFWAKCSKSGECIIWHGRPSGSGYGQVWSGGKLVLAHRHAYSITFGPIPDGMQIDHVCGNVMCVNPAHLEVVTMAENMRRKSLRRTECKRGHVYTDDNLYNDGKTGRKHCRACRALNNRTLAEKKKLLA